MERKPQCPSCGSENIFYVERAMNYWSFTHVENNYVELEELQSSVIDYDFSPYFECDICSKTFTFEDVVKLYEETQ